MRQKKVPEVIGWREWVHLPSLNVDWVKAKIDTGATSSAIHAIHLKYIEEDGKQFVTFHVHPIQRSTKLSIPCKAEVFEFRKVRSSSGHETKRPVILADIVLKERRWKIELTLTNRDEMGFRMLLGREAFRNKFLVDAGKSYLSEIPEFEKKETKRSTKSSKIA